MLSKMNQSYILFLTFFLVFFFFITQKKGGELFFHLSNEVRFSVNRTKFYAAELVLAIGHLHSMQIIYRDLKPENVVLDGDGHAVMTDFGLAKKEVTDETPTQTFCGTPEVS
jgi:serine/threonine protein kinase